MDKPDWTFWLNLPEVEVSIACALSCDVSPRALDDDGERFVRAEEVEVRREYGRRSTFASEAIEAGKLKANWRGAFDRSIPHVTLRDFRAWGESLPIPLTFPAQFPVLMTKAMHQQVALASAKASREIEDGPTTPAAQKREPAGLVIGINRPTIALPPVGDYIDTLWIPDLLAKARFPDDDSLKTVIFFYVPAVKGSMDFSSLMSESDEALLRDIWKALPDPVLPMTLAAWKPYEDAYNNATVRPERGLRWTINDPQANVQLKRAAVKREYQGILDAAIEDGSLEVRSEGTLAIVRPPISDRRKLFATREALKGFFERVGFEVVERRALEHSWTQEPDTLDPRRRTSYLLIIRMLLHKAGMGTQQRNEAKTIAQALGRLQLEAPDRKTISSVLKEARELK